MRLNLIFIPCLHIHTKLRAKFDFSIQLTSIEAVLFFTDDSFYTFGRPDCVLIVAVRITKSKTTWEPTLVPL